MQCNMSTALEFEILTAEVTEFYLLPYNTSVR